MNGGRREIYHPVMENAGKGPLALIPWRKVEGQASE